MRLTNSLRDAFVNGVLRDIPVIDYNEIMRKTALQAAKDVMPVEVRAAYEKHPSWFQENWGRRLGGEYFYLPVPNETEFSSEANQTIKDLAARKSEQTEKIDEIRRRLRGAAYSVSTTKALREMFPEFSQYIPEDETKTKNLPALANIVADVIKAGWPKGKPA